MNDEKGLLRIDDGLSIAYFAEDGMAKALILSGDEVCEVWNSFPAITLRDYDYWLNKLREILNAESNDQSFRLFKRGNIFVARALAEDSILSNFEIKNFKDVINEICLEGTVVIVNIKHDEELYRVIDSKIKALEKKLEKVEDEDERQEIQEKLEELKIKLREIPVLIDLIIASKDFAGRLRMMKLIEDNATISIKWDLGEVTWDDLLKMLKSPNSKFKIGRKIRLTSTYENLRSWLYLPMPEEYLKALDNYLASKEYLEPLIKSSKSRFRIGKWIDGSDAVIPADDFYYCYILSSSGYHNCPLLRILVHNLRNEGAVIVLDTDGEFAQIIAKEISDSLYFHPIDSPFGVNPLDLPKISNKDKAVSLITGKLHDILCINIKDQRLRNILENTVKALYSRSDVRLSDLYKLFKLARDGLIFAEDEKLCEQLIDFRELPEESASFLLNILKPYVENEILRRLTSKTTIPIDEVLKPGRVTLFSIPKSELGEDLAYRILTVILFRIWTELKLAKSHRVFVFIIYTLKRRAEIFEKILMESIPNVNMGFIFASTDIKQLSEETLAFLWDMAYLFVLSPIVSSRIKNEFVKKLVEGVKEFKNAITDNVVVFSFNMTSEFMTLIKIDDLPYRPVREKITTDKFAPPQDEDDNILEKVGHPVLRYISNPLGLLKQRSLYLLYWAKYSDDFGDLLEICENSRDLFNLTIFEDPYPILRYFHENIGKVAKSEEGRKVAERVIEFYVTQGYCVDIAKQLVGEPRPDLIAIPISKGYLDLSRAIAIEIDTTTPDKSPTQLWRNWTKESVKYFTEIHSWIIIDKLERVLKLYEELPHYLKVKVRIFAYDMENDVVYGPEHVHRLIREEKEGEDEGKSFELTPLAEEKTVIVRHKEDKRRRRVKRISNLHSLDHFLKEESEEIETVEEKEENVEERTDKVITLPDGRTIQILDDLSENELRKVKEYVEKGRYSIRDDILTLISEFGYKEGVVRIKIIS